MSITGPDSGTYTSTNSLTFSNFPNLQGNADVDAFTFSGTGPLGGLLSGAGGNDTLQARDVANV